VALRIEQRATAAIAPRTFDAIVRLCDEAYQESTASYFDDIGPGEHLLGWDGEVLASHLMWVPRLLAPAGSAALRTAYVEMVATAGAMRGRGYASRLLEMLPELLAPFELAALAPATDSLYLRLGWRYWEGPLGHRKDGALVPDDEERVMFLRLPKTPPDLDPRAPLSCEWRPGEVW